MAKHSSKIGSAPPSPVPAYTTAAVSAHAGLKTFGAKKPPVDQRKKSKRHKKKNYTGHTVSIYRVLKQVHPQLGVSRNGMGVLTSLVNDVVERLSVEAGRLSQMNSRKTLGAREVQSAVRLVFPGELSKHAVSEGIKAVTKFNQTVPAKVAKK